MSTPPVKTRRDYLVEKAVGALVVQLAGAVLVGSLAISRADGHTLSAGFLAGLVAAAALVAGSIGWVNGLFEAVVDRAEGKVAGSGGDPSPAADDAFAGPVMWRRSVVWGVATFAWALAGGLLVGAVLAGERAAYLVTIVSLFVFPGLAAAAVAVAAHGTGLDTPRRAAHPVPLRHRAWRHVAVPIGVSQVVVNAAFAYLLFRDYATGDALAERALTESEALADAAVVVTLLTVLFGYIAGRWGRADALTGRVALPEDAVRGVGPKSPLGIQGLVYVGLVSLVLFQLSGLVLPALPSLPAVMVVRGVLAGAIATMAAAVAYTRGALNTAAVTVGEAAAERPAAPEPAAPPQSPAGPASRRRPVATATSVLVLAVLAWPVAAPLVRPGEAVAAASIEDRRLAAEGEAFAIRVEYDVPLPAGTGSIPRVAGRVGPPSGDNAWGLAAAPSHLDPVVGGTYADPVKDEDPLTEGQQADNGLADESRYPLVECFHPGDLVDVAFLHPTDMRPELEAAPPLGHARATCGSDPRSEVDAAVLALGGPGTPTEAFGAVVTAEAASARGAFRPDQGVLRSTSAATASGVSLLDGVVTIRQVSVTGESSVTGEPGDQHTAARVVLEDITVGGVQFSIANDRIVVGDQSFPVDSSAGRTVVDAANAALAATGCALDVIGPTERYPQGFLLSRENPPVGIDDDGTFAGSMAAGLMVLCDIPEAISGNTELNPQRLQIVVGFVFTSAEAKEDVGGFGIGDLAGAGVPAAPVPTPVAVSPAAVAPGPAAPAAVSPPEPASPAPEPSEPRRRPQPVATVVPFVARAGIFGHPVLWVTAAAAWAALTHAGITRLRRALR